jgi:flagellar hook-associated protein 1 FlgK
MHTALTGLFTSQAGMRTVSNNITNVNTEGYARQVNMTESIVIAGNIGGVRIAEVRRVVDQFLEDSARTANSDAAAAEIRRQIHDNFQGVLGRPDSEGALNARIDKLFTEIASLSLDPSSSVMREGVLGTLEDVTLEIKRISAALQELRSSTNQKITEEVAKANEALKRISELNPLIVRQTATGGGTAGLETQRTTALEQLAEVMDIDVRIDATGFATITTTKGATLVDLAVRELEYLGPGLVSAETRFPSIKLNRLDAQGNPIGTPLELDAEVTSGSLRALIDMRDGDLENLSKSLGQLTAQFTDKLNAVHNAYSAVPAPNQLSGKTTFIEGPQAPGFTGITTFSIVDQNSIVQQEFAMDFGAFGGDFNAAIAAVNAGLAGTGTLALTNGVMSFTSTNPLHGVVMTDDATTPSLRGGQGFSHFFGMNDLLEASVESNYNTGLTGAENHLLAAGGSMTWDIVDANNSILTSYTYNVGGASFNDILADLNAPGALGNYMTFSFGANGELVQTPQPGFTGVEVAVVSDTTDLGSNGITFSKVFGVGDKYKVNTTIGLQITSAISNDPGRLSLSAYDLTVGIGNVALGRGDQTGVLALQAIQDQAIAFHQAGELAAMTISLTQYTGAFLANSGFMGARASDNERDAIALKNEIDGRRSDVSGVNLDEELSNMIILQNSFNASARLITTAQEMMDTIMNL